jgi:hypothetical protein
MRRRRRLRSDQAPARARPTPTKRPGEALAAKVGGAEVVELRIGPRSTDERHALDGECTQAEHCGLARRCGRNTERCRKPRDQLRLLREPNGVRRGRRGVADDADRIREHLSRLVQNERIRQCPEPSGRRRRNASGAGESRLGWNANHLGGHEPSGHSRELFLWPDRRVRRQHADPNHEVRRRR